MPKTRNCGFPKCPNMDYFTKDFSFFEHFFKTTSGNSAPICNNLEFDENMSEYYFNIQLSSLLFLKFE